MVNKDTSLVQWLSPSTRTSQDDVMILEGLYIVFEVMNKKNI